MANQYRATNQKTGEVIEGTIKELAKQLNAPDYAFRNAVRYGGMVDKMWTVERVESVPGFEKNCARCGKQFYGCRQDVRYCCVECQKEATKERAKELRQIKQEEMRKRRDRQQSIAQIAIKARQAGMTYGQYVAQMGL